MKRNIYGYTFRNAEPANESPASPAETPKDTGTQPTTQTATAPNGQPITIHLHNPPTTSQVTKELETPKQPETPVSEPPKQVVTADTLMALAGVPDVIKPLISSQPIETLATYLTSPEYKELVNKLAPSQPTPETPKPEPKGQEPPKGDTKSEPTLPKTFSEVNSEHLNLFKQLFTEI